MNNNATVLVIAALPESLINFRYHLLQAMVARGHTVIACAAARDALSAVESAEVREKLARIGVAYQPIPLERTGVNPLRDLRTFAAIFALCRRLKPDVLFCYTAKPVIYGSLAGSLAGVPAIHSMITGLGFGVTTASSLTGFATSMVRTLYRSALAKNRTAIFHNPDDRDGMISAGLLSPRTTPVIVNGSGVDVAHFTPAPLPREPITFLLIARLLGEKGVREYARAAELVKARYPQTRCVLVGPLAPHPDAIQEQEVRAWEAAGSIHWAGPVSDVRAYLREASVYVLPSHHEGTPRTVLEAMAMGRPIITTDAPGCRETVIDGDNGLLVPVQDAEALAHAMERFLAEPALLERMGQRSRRLAEEKYDVHRVNEAMLRAMGLS